MSSTPRGGHLRPILESPPHVAVVVPTYAREFARCLESLARLNYPRSRLQVIVVDDGNAEPVALGLRSDLDVTIVRQRHGGPARARNEGARRARSQLVAFIDDDCAADPDWLTALTSHLTHSPGGAVGGRTANVTPKNPYATATTLLIDLLFARHNARPDDASFLTSCNLLVPVARFQEVGGFDTSFAFPGGEDREFCARWRHRGFPMAYVPEAVVYHTPADRLLPFVRQHFNYGRGASRLHRMAALQRGLSAPKQSLSFYRSLFSRPFSALPPHEAVPVAALLVVCQLATIAGYLRERAW